MKPLSITAAARERPSAPAIISARGTMTFAQAAAAAAAAPRAGDVATRPSVEAILSIYAALDDCRPLGGVATAPSDTLAVLQTSGSTGAAKRVILTRGAFLAASTMSAAHLGVDPDDRWLLCLPIDRTGGLSVVLRALVHRQPLIVCEGAFDPVAVARLGRQARATMASVVPAQLDALVACGESLPRFRAVLVGGAAASPAILERARHVRFLKTYGMTETWGQVATQALADAGRPDAPLVPLPGVRISAGTRDAPAPIVVDTPAAMLGYVGEPPHRGPIGTTDVGYLDMGAPPPPRPPPQVPRTDRERAVTECATYLVVVGRADDVIVTGGEKVHPAQVEAAVAGAPGVAQACAFGVPDERWGEIVACAIVPRGDVHLDTLRAWISHLPSKLRPRRIEVVDTLPLLDSGKIDRRALRQRLS
jgi:O-succinylbenzoic acid--CoA ligase